MNINSCNEKYIDTISFTYVSFPSKLKIHILELKVTDMRTPPPRGFKPGFCHYEVTLLIHCAAAILHYFTFQIVPGSCNDDDT